MKNIFLFLISIFFVTSCNTKEKYQGKWTNYYLKYGSQNETRGLSIENDSIKIDYPYFNNHNKYPLIIKKGKLKFNNITLNASIKKDTLTLNDSIYFVKDNNDTLYGSDILLKIDLPKVPNFTNSFYDNNKWNNYIYFGKRLDNNQFSLQLNDKYASIKDLLAFITVEKGHIRCELTPFPTAVLFIDNSTPMKFIEDIFYNLSKVNQLKVSLINNLNLKFNDSLGIYYKHEGLVKKLPPLWENDSYNTNTSNEIYSAPPPPPLSLPMFNNKKPQTKFVLLKNDTIYFNDKIIKTNSLKKLIKPWIEKNIIIFNLYDLESSYGKFLEMNSLFNSAYMEIREQNAQIKFYKSLHKLNRDELTEIKMQTQMNHLWSYSIPHYNAVIKNDKLFFGLKVHSID